MEKKTLEIVFKDESDNNLSMSFTNPKENIQTAELRALETTIVENKVFVGKTGNIKGFGKAFIREVKETNLLEG